MHTYRLICRDGTDGATASATIECATDRDAVEIAEQVIGDRDRIEVWQGNRPVALIGNPRRVPAGVHAATG